MVRADLRVIACWGKYHAESNSSPRLHISGQPNYTQQGPDCTQKTGDASGGHNFEVSTECPKATNDVSSKKGCLNF